MSFYRIEYPAYADRPANVLHVNGEASRDLHMAQIENKGGKPIATQVQREEYIAAFRKIFA